MNIQEALRKWKPVIENYFGKDLDEKKVEFMSVYADHHSMREEIGIYNTPNSFSSLPLILKIIRRLPSVNNLILLNSPSGYIKDKRYEVSDICFYADAIPDNVLYPDPTTQQEEIIENKMIEYFSDSSKKIGIYMFIDKIGYSENKMVAKSRIVIL